MKRLLILPLFLKYKYDLYQLRKRERVGGEESIHRNEVLLLVTQKYKGFKKLMIIYQESRLCRIDKSLYVENLPRLNHEKINNLNRLLTSIFF